MCKFSDLLEHKKEIFYQKNPKRTCQFSRFLIIKLNLMVQPKKILNKCTSFFFVARSFLFKSFPFSEFRYKNLYLGICSSRENLYRSFPNNIKC